MAILGDDENTIHVMILDLGLPPKAHTTEEGLDVIVQTTSAMHATKIIVLTGQDEEKSALDAIREGAFDFLSKPAKSEDILTAVNRAILFHSKEQDLSTDGMTRV
jgi:DNA-binding NtrC family response regulator